MSIFGAAVLAWFRCLARCPRAVRVRERYDLQWRLFITVDLDESDHMLFASGSFRLLRTCLRIAYAPVRKVVVLPGRMTTERLEMRRSVPASYRRINLRRLESTLRRVESHLHLPRSPDPNLLLLRLMTQRLCMTVRQTLKRPHPVNCPRFVSGGYVEPDTKQPDTAPAANATAEPAGEPAPVLSEPSH